MSDDDTSRKENFSNELKNNPYNDEFSELQELDATLPKVLDYSIDNLKTYMKGGIEIRQISFSYNDSAQTQSKLKSAIDKIYNSCSTYLKEQNIDAKFYKEALFIIQRFSLKYLVELFELKNQNEDKFNAYMNLIFKGTDSFREKFIFDQTNNVTELVALAPGLSKIQNSQIIWKLRGIEGINDGLQQAGEQVHRDYIILCNKHFLNHASPNKVHKKQNRCFCC